MRTVGLVFKKEKKADPKKGDEKKDTKREKTNENKDLKGNKTGDENAEVQE